MTVCVMVAGRWHNVLGFDLIRQRGTLEDPSTRKPIPYTPDQVMASLRDGDRIELTSMQDDPNPVPIGTKGTVEWVDVQDLGNGPSMSVAVKWDNGRSLGLICPPDTYNKENKQP